MTYPQPGPQEQNIGQPHPHYGQPPYYPPQPWPGYPARKPPPWHHIVTWPAWVLAVIAEIVAETSVIADYQMVIIMGFLAMAGGIGALVVSIRANHGWCIVVAACAIILGVIVTVAGYGAMEDFERIVDETLAPYGY